MCYDENKQSPLANIFPSEVFLQNGFLTIIKLLLEFVLTWLSIINFLAKEMLVKVIDLETASGKAQMTCLHLYFLIILLFSQIMVMKSFLLLSTVMT